MSRRCTVCAHPDRAGIDAAIVAGKPYRRIATQHSLTEAAIRRHRVHIPADISKAHHAREITRADDLLARVQRHLEKLDTALEAAAVARDIAALAREARETARLLLEVEGRLRVAPQVAVTVNLATAPEFLALVARVKQALLPYREAYTAVVAELEGAKVSRAAPALLARSPGHATAVVISEGGGAGT